MDLRAAIEAYNDAWNRQDLDAIHAAHADDVVFENHTAGERAEGAAAVREHIAGIFATQVACPASGLNEVSPRANSPAKERDPGQLHWMTTR